MEKISVVIEKAAHNYSAYLPDIPGCISTGESIEETLQNIKDALEFHLETMAEEKLELPKVQSLEKHLNNGDIVLDDDVIIASIKMDIPLELHTII